MRILLQEDDRGCCPTLLRGSEEGGVVSVEPGLDKGMGKEAKYRSRSSFPVQPVFFHVAAGKFRTNPSHSSIDR